MQHPDDSELVFLGGLKTKVLKESIFSTFYCGIVCVSIIFFSLAIYNVELGRFFFISREKQQADLADRIP